MYFKVQLELEVQHQTSVLILYPGGIPKREPPSCEAPREPTIYTRR